MSHRTAIRPACGRTAVTLLAALLAFALTAPALESAAARTAPAASPAPSPRADRDDGSQVSGRDVYWVNEDGALVNPDGATPDDADLFNAAGLDLDLTWGEYSRARGRSLAIADPHRDRTRVIVRLRGLVPGGVYSLFYETFAPDSEAPGCAGIVRDRPVHLTAGPRPRPDRSSFTANDHGRARLVGVIDTDLLAPELSGLHVVYHADGSTYHPLPNRRAFETRGEKCRSSYGIDAMRQLVLLQKWF